MAEYSKEMQNHVKAGTAEAAALLKRASFRGKSNNKYKAKKQGGAQGRIYDSQLEADYSNLLESQKMAGDIFSFKPQHHLQLYVDGVKICSYVIDFQVMHNDGRMELIEVKGAETREWLNKWKLTKALIPTGQIEGIPKDCRLTLVKREKGRFSHYPQNLNYK